jgi:hypothetical protein
MSKTSPTIIPASEILETATNKALAPYLETIRAACKRDIELQAATTASHPETAKTRAQEIEQAAVNGDASAMKQLEEAGGTEALAKKLCALFPVHEAAAKNHALSHAQLLQDAGNAIADGMEAAIPLIETQLVAVMGSLSEPVTESRWSQTLRHRANILRANVRRAQLGLGVDWVIKSSGISI